MCGRLVRDPKYDFEVSNERLWAVDIAGRIERQPTGPGTRTLSPANQAVLDDLRSGISIEDVAARHGRSVARVTLMARAYGIDNDAAP